MAYAKPWQSYDDHCGCSARPGLGQGLGLKLRLLVVDLTTHEGAIDEDQVLHR